MRECYYTLCGVEEGLTANFRAAIDEQYYKQLKKPIVGYRGIKIKDYFDHLDTKWCKLDTNSISEMKAEYYQKWVGEEHVTDFGKRLDDEQTALSENDITISNTDKQQFYIEQMYASRQFTREAMIRWEDKATADKTWANAKSFFEEEVAKDETYRNNSNGTTADSRYESAANLSEQGDALRDYLQSIKEADNSANLEYMQQMTATNETMMSMISKFQEQLNAKDAQIALILKQNADIMAALTKMGTSGGGGGGGGDDKENANPNRRPRNRCTHCNSTYNHGDRCYELPANKSKRPSHWKSTLAKPLE